MRTFNLIRYFSLLTFALIVLAGIVLGELVRHQRIGELTRMAEDRNVAMTGVFRNALWRDFATLATQEIPDMASAGPHLRAIAEKKGLRSKVVALMQESETIKIKVYNTRGLTVFSTDEAQTGEDKSANAGFLAARSGQLASELTHRNQFSNFEGERENRDVLGSYVPIVEGGQVVGVVESYLEVTRFIQQIEREHFHFWAVILGVLGALYFMQLLVVRRAQKILKTQEQALEESNRELDQRVIARTQELALTNRQLEQEMAEHRRTQGQLEYLSFYDALTRLPNRSLLLNRLKKAVAGSAENNQYGALLFVDLDHFKTINDTEGRACGDALLQDVARSLQTSVRERDTVARLGNDQFLIMLESLGKTGLDAATLAEAAAETIQVCLRETGEEKNRSLDCSIGIALFAGETRDLDNLVKQSEMAMYDAKSAGRGALRFFDPEMQTAATARALLEKDFHEALRTEQFLLHYQAQVSADQKIRGAEALVRWQHPQRGMVSPVKFIPFAEESGLIAPLGRWILASACAQIAAWAKQPELAVITVAVNISARQFREPDFVEEVLDVLTRTGAPANRLKLEVTESLMLENIDDIVAKMQQLRAHGISFSLDDFGTGYSSLSYLTRLPLDQIKIDKSFVMELEASNDSAMLCASIINLAHNLKLKIVAEGVETEAQSYFLSTVHHCDLMQGYRFSRPIAAADFEALVRGH